VFWPRLENFLSFVLIELRQFLFVGQNRLEMGETLRKNRSKVALHRTQNATCLARERPWD
jgi:hypothetical protein